ncbi:MAG: tetratricopeptide repeat protein, partial [Oscillospiraceae bacterium]
MEKVLKNKKILLAVVAALLVILAVIFTFTALGSGANSAKQLSLGDKYLTQLNYDKAIIAFTKAIKIDPMNPKAYIGLADAYIGGNNTDKAIETLTNGYEKTKDETIKTKLDEI